MKAYQQAEGGFRLTEAVADVERLSAILEASSRYKPATTPYGTICFDEMTPDCVATGAYCAALKSGIVDLQYAIRFKDEQELHSELGRAERALDSLEAAVLAERERCAKIAEDGWECGEVIAEEIRKG